LQYFAQPSYLRAKEFHLSSPLLPLCEFPSAKTKETRAQSKQGAVRKGTAAFVFPAAAK